MRTVDILLPSYKPHPGWDLKITQAMEGLCRYFSGRDVELSLYLVNDGSDSSYYSEDALSNLRQCVDGRFTYLRYTPNHGKGYALRYGAARSTGEFLVYTDTDFPFGWETVAEAIEKLVGGADVVMGQRGPEYTASLSPLRRLLSRGVRWMNHFLMGLPDAYLDAQSGLKGFNASGRGVFLQTTVDTFVFDSEFIMMSWNRNLDIQTVRLSLAPGLKMSRMGLKIMFREAFLFFRVFIRNRLFGPRRQVKP